MKTIEEITTLRNLIQLSQIGKSERLWGGADVAVVRNLPKKNPEVVEFYPDPYFVVSKHNGHEISWMFEKLRDSFYAEKLIDYCSKFEFFGRLARAANRGIEKTEDSDVCIICTEILNEAEKMHSEIMNGIFEELVISSGNVIADDLKEKK